MSNETKLIDRARKAANRLYLAGFGATTVVRDQASEVFEDLVKQGEKVDRKLRKNVSKKVEDIRVQADSRISDVRARIEKTYDERVVSVVNKVVAPTREGIERINKRLDELTETVSSLPKGRRVKAKAKDVEAEVETAVEVDDKAA